MPLLHCTRKLLKEMGVSPTAASRVAPDESKWGSWYANLLFVDRRKCVLFVHARTLASFLVGDLARAEMRNMNEVFRNGWGRYLLQEEFPAALVEALLSEYKELTPATAHDKTVLGSMNDLAAHYKYEIPIMGSLKPEDLSEPIQKLNRMPMGAVKYAYAIEELRALLGLERRVAESNLVDAGTQSSGGSHG
jgi:hypothetical protein